MCENAKKRKQLHTLWPATQVVSHEAARILMPAKKHPVAPISAGLFGRPCSARRAQRAGAMHRKLISA